MPANSQTIEKLQKKLDKDPGSYVFSQLGEEHRKEGNFDDAIRILKTGLTKHPNYWSARVTLGRVYDQMGNKVAAREELEKVVQAVPDNLLANRLLGDIYTVLQLPAEALKRYRLVQMITPGDQELKSVIMRLESEVAEPPPVLLPALQAEPAEPEGEQLETVKSDTMEPEPEEEEVYAPTIQIQIPEFLEKTEVPVEPEQITSVGEPSEEVITNPHMEPVNAEEPEGDQEGTIETLILKPEREPAIEENVTPIDDHTPSDSEQLSTLAELLLSTEPPAEPEIDEEPAELDVREFEELEEDSGESFHPAQQDRTQPIAEGEEAEFEEAEDLTSETLADLYLNQGFVDKAVNVYQRLLLEEPDNQQIIRKLAELNPDSHAIEQEPVYEEKELLVVESQDSSRAVSADVISRSEQERRRKISTLENWLTTIRRERE